MTKKLFQTLAVTCLLLLGCSNTDEDNCNVVSCRTSSLIYQNINRPFTSIYGSHNDYSGKIFFDYNGDKIVTIHGGLQTILLGVNQSGYALSDYVTTNITYEGSTVIVDTNSDYPDEFVIQNQKLVSRRTKGQHYPFSMITYTYEYLNDLIIERLDNQITCKYYFTNGNLQKVEYYKNLDANTFYKQRELILSNFDNSDNLLKGLFFVEGAFYKAFCQNNYQKVEINEYFHENEELILYSTYSTTNHFNTNENGISEIFEIQCN
ncbi:hypothetical protein [Mangrovimonas sp. TPBH4]|uniref:hypothetical protein n=1 Tax=Mangrovimonas sp. TPBH4 TaxID=1645914 RepID=UPI0006B5D31F|nr:hypothetical protein [Mangrovimonas sp. TPBH4]